MRRNICNKNENFPKNFQIIPDSQTVIASQNFRIAHFPFPFSKEIVLSPFLSFFSLADHPGQAITSFFPFLHFFPSLSFFSPLFSFDWLTRNRWQQRERERERDLSSSSTDLLVFLPSLYIYNRTHTHTLYLHLAAVLFCTREPWVGLGQVTPRLGPSPSPVRLCDVPSTRRDYKSRAIKTVVRRFDGPCQAALSS